MNHYDEILEHFSMEKTLLERLKSADIVCRDCGQKYGKYSVGCSSTWMGICGVCGEEKGVTEVRDWGYLTKGINSPETMETEPPAPITLEFTEEEIRFLHDCLETIQEYHYTLNTPRPLFDDVPLFESIEVKITEAYEDNCVKYNLSPVILEYNKKYGTWGTGEDAERWQKFKDNYDMLLELGFIT